MDASLAIRLAESGLLPDSVIRWGIRRMLRTRLEEITATDCEQALAHKRALLAHWSHGPIALVPEKANDQHYEVASEFFEQLMGRRLKYSCGLSPVGNESLDASEERMLDLTCRRAELCDGMRVLDLGCGWGSLSLWIAEHYPNTRVVAVSNSKPQREFILRRCDRLALDNVDVVTADINHFDPRGLGPGCGAEHGFDRVVSVEMFEHVRNHARLLSRIARWLAPEGKLFVHHFSHRDTPYPFESRGAGDWMARVFFSGGVMPSDDLLSHFQDDLRIDQQWRVNGNHYARTCNLWAQRIDERRDLMLPTLAKVYGEGDEEVWLQRWKIFCLACAELFAFNDGNEWWVTHVLMSRRDRVRR